MNFAIAKEIVKAQIASDGGKGIKDIADTIDIGGVYCKKGYDIKDVCIRKAIKMINRCKKSGFYYFVQSCDDFTNPCYIVYFNFKIDGERYQVSFHTFSDLDHFCNQKTTTRWSKKVSSRESAVVLARCLKE